MIEFKRILWPTDFSEPSLHSLEKAEQLALHFGAELLLTHIVAPIPVIAASEAPMALNVPQYQKELETDAKERLNEIQSNKVSEEVRSRVLIRHGDAAERIDEVAKEEGADLIVITTHGWTGWRHMVFGSVAEKVVRMAPCPVLTIRTPEQKEQAKRSK